MIKKVCSECKSDNIVAANYAIWNPYEGNWKLNDTVFSDFYCNNCESECDIEDVEIEDDEYDEEDLLVCEKCGGTNIQTKAWVDSNTLQYKDSTGDNYDDDNWCDDCEEHVNVCLKSEYIKDQEDEELL